MIKFFGDNASCRDVKYYRRFGVWYCLHAKHSSLQEHGNPHKKDSRNFSSRIIGVIE